jgi:DNA-binding protein H-NS
MKTYREIQAEIKNLQAKAEKARRAELANVIADMRAKIQEYGLTEADLFSKRAKRTAAKSPKKTGTVKPKYRNPATGETWTGRGKPPKWIAGQDREQFLIT